MSARGAMTMRAEVSHAYRGPDDDWGQPGIPTHQSAVTVPCWTWSKVKKHVRDDLKTAIVEDLRAIVPIATRDSGNWINLWASGWATNWTQSGRPLGTFPTSTEIAQGDRITITDRLGRTLYGGPIAVEHVTLRRGGGSSSGHLELMLARHV